MGKLIKFRDNVRGIKKCSKCNGMGYILIPGRASYEKNQETCTKCHGRGNV